jgi:hypothetical protein
VIFVAITRGGARMIRRRLFGVEQRHAYQRRLVSR